MPQYTEQYEDTDDLLDELDIEEDDDDDDDDEGFIESEGFDDDDDEGFIESEGFDDDDESLAERRRRRKRFPRFRRRRFRPNIRRPRKFRPVRSIRNAVIRTPAGTAQVRLPKSVATRASVNARFQEVKQEIARNAKGLKKVDMTLEKNTSIVDKKVNAVRSDLRRSNKKMGERLQQAMMMPLLMQSKPKLKTIEMKREVDDPNNAGEKFTEESKFTVTDQEFQSDSNNLLPLVMMMGGMGGGGSSNMMIMMMALSGGFGK